MRRKMWRIEVAECAGVAEGPQGAVDIALGQML